MRQRLVNCVYGSSLEQRQRDSLYFLALCLGTVWHVPVQQSLETPVFAKLSFFFSFFFFNVGCSLGGIIWCVHPSGGGKECCATGLHGVPMEFYIDFPVFRTLRIWVAGKQVAGWKSTTGPGCISLKSTETLGAWGELSVQRWLYSLCTFPFCMQLVPKRMTVTWTSCE